MGEQVSHCGATAISFARPYREYHRGKAQWQELHGGPQGTSWNRCAPEHWGSLGYRQHLHPNQTEVKIQGSVCPWVSGVQLKKLYLASFMPAWSLSVSLFWILIHFEEVMFFLQALLLQLLSYVPRLPEEKTLAVLKGQILIINC